jgi:ribosomal protein S18 acetylase RimI-like enzyme
MARKKSKSDFTTERTSFSGFGLGRRMHDFALPYFRSWEAARIELHVSPTNADAVAFYRSLRYRLAELEPGVTQMWRMERNATPGWGGWHQS